MSTGLSMSNIRFFKTFIAVAEYGSFAAAADRVALTNAAVGQQMRALEEEMRRPLFDRSQRQIKLSRDGVLLLPKAKRLLADYEQMIAEAPDGMAMEGEVSIGGITSGMGLLANCLVQLKKLHPRISVNLMTARSEEVVNLIHAAKLDAALLIETSRQNFNGMSWTLLYNEPIVMLANATQTAGINDAVELLRTQPFIRYDRSTAVGRKVQSIIKSESVEPLEILELNSIIGIADLVRQQVGVAIVPLLKNFDWHKDPSLRVLPLPGDLAVRRVGILEQGTKSAITGEIRKLLMSAVAT